MRRGKRRSARRSTPPSWLRTGGPDVCAALVRSAGLSWRLAFVIVLFTPLVALTNAPQRPPSASDAPPIVMPLPVVAGVTWANRGHVVHLESYADPPLADGVSVLGAAWRA